MVRVTLLGAFVLAFALAPAAFAHVTLTPRRVAPGTPRLLRFTVPDERQVDAVGLTIRFPAAIAVRQVEAKPGWSVVVAAAEAAWHGGRIHFRTFETFTVSASIPPSTRPFRLIATERYANGAVDTYPLLLDARPRLVAAARGRDSGARTLGKAALGVALAAAAVALGAGFFALYLWFRSPVREGSRS